MTLNHCFGILFLLMVMQVIGTHLQVKNYRETVGKLHKLGNLGIGSSRRKLGAGSIVIISCKSDGTITGGEEMTGMTIFSGFKEIRGIVGKNIYSLKEEILQMPEGRKKFYKAQLQAIEALETRLNSKSEEAA